MDRAPIRGRKRAAEESPSPPDADNSDDEAPETTRTRLTNELDTLDLIPENQAWQLNVEKLLGDYSQSIASRSLIILCVMGELDVHYWQLRSVPVPFYLDLSSVFHCNVIAFFGFPHSASMS